MRRRTQLVLMAALAASTTALAACRQILGVDGWTVQSEGEDGGQTGADASGDEMQPLGADTGTDTGRDALPSVADAGDAGLPVTDADAGHPATDADAAVPGTDADAGPPVCIFDNSATTFDHCVFAP